MTPRDVFTSPRSAYPCGSAAGFHRHRRHQEAPCSACRFAHQSHPCEACSEARAFQRAQLDAAFPE